MGAEMVKGTVKIPACLLIKFLSQRLGSKTGIKGVELFLALLLKKGISQAIMNDHLV